MFWEFMKVRSNMDLPPWDGGMGRAGRLQNGIDLGIGIAGADLLRKNHGQHQQDCQQEEKEQPPPAVVVPDLLTAYRNRACHGCAPPSRIRGSST